MPGYMTNNKSFTSRMKTRTLVGRTLESWNSWSCPLRAFIFIFHASRIKSGKFWRESVAYFFATGQRICKRFWVHSCRVHLMWNGHEFTSRCGTLLLRWSYENIPGRHVSGFKIASHFQWPIRSVLTQLIIKDRWVTRPTENTAI